MKIAHIIPYSVIFPLKSHNGRYEWVRQLALLQVQQGHDVTIYGNPNSIVEGLRFAGIPDQSGDRVQNNIETFRHAFMQDEDVYHSHFDTLHYAVGSQTPKPVIYTQHWWPNEELITLSKQTALSNVWAVPPTQYMYDFDKASGIHTNGHIYHGIDMNIFKPAPVEKNDRLIFVGRISPEKNLHIALSVAQKAGAKLDIIGKVAPKNESYWQSLQPYIDGEYIRYLGPLDKPALITAYSAARGVISPFAVTEPFGLVAVEAQACGTPIIMTRGGSRSELVDDGKTGFLCETEEEFVAAIKNLETISSDDCVAFAKRFDINEMASAYERLYAKLSGR